MMANSLRFAGALALLCLVALSSPASAQKASLDLVADIELRFDCESPFSVKNHPMSATFTAVLNQDKSASAVLLMKGKFWSSKVNFDVNLGRGSQAAPGGTSSLRVMPGNRLQGVWDLPNNQLILNIAGHGRSCAANVVARLKPGKQTYTLFDGSIMYYCSSMKVVRTTCRAN